MRRKGKPDKFPPPSNFIIEQSSTMKKLGYFSLIGGIFCCVAILSDWDIENTQDDAVPFVMISFAIMFLMCIFFPLRIITNKKKIIVKNGKFIIESNRKKYRVNQDFKNLIWWREMDGIKNGSPEGGYQLHLKFPYQKVTLDYLDFKSFYQLKQLLKTNYKEKKKTKSYP